jgi:predicted peptidase
MRPTALAVASVIIALVSNAAADAKNYVARTFTGPGNKTLGYRIFIPKDYSANKRYPLMLALHGSGERGSDNLAQLKYPFTHMWSDSALQAKYPSFAVAPQCPIASSGWDAALLGALLDSLGREFSLDPTRMYVSGLSMGGFGTWSLVTKYPGRFTAAVPVCGGGDTTKAAALVYLPIWVFHGDADPIVPVANSRTMVAAIKASGGSLVLYTEYKGVGHESWIPAAKEPGLVDWIFSQVHESGVLAPPVNRRGALPRLTLGPKGGLFILVGAERFDLMGRR